ncbi:MAG: hypothetical protein ACYC7A_03740 [Thermoanaerobaculia bacterium]
MLVWVGFQLLVLGPGHRDPVGDTALGFIILLVGTLGIITAAGLWRIRPWGRHFQILLSFGGLFTFPIGTMLAAFSLAYLFTRRATLTFSGIRPDELAHENIDLVRGRALLVERGMVAAMLLSALAGAMVAFVPFAKGPLRDASRRADQKADQKESMEAMQNVAAALERYARKHREYPKVVGAEAMIDSLAEVQRQGDPPLTARDGWDRVLWYSTDKKGWNYWLVCSGADLQFEEREAAGYTPGLTRDLDDDLVVKNSQFVRHPDTSEAP